MNHIMYSFIVLLSCIIFRRIFFSHYLFFIDFTFGKALLFTIESFFVKRTLILCTIYIVLYVNYIPDEHKNYYLNIIIKSIIVISRIMCPLIISGYIFLNLLCSLIKFISYYLRLSFYFLVQKMMLRL